MRCVLCFHIHFCAWADPFTHVLALPMIFSLWQTTCLFKFLVKIQGLLWLAYLYWGCTIDLARQHWCGRHVILWTKNIAHSSWVVQRLHWTVHWEGVVEAWVGAHGGQHGRSALGQQLGKVDKGCDKLISVLRLNKTTKTFLDARAIFQTGQSLSNVEYVNFHTMDSISSSQTQRR